MCLRHSPKKWKNKQTNKINLNKGRKRREEVKLKQSNPNTETTDLEHEIDQLVYQLYGLTEKEIAIIEESCKQK